MAYKVDEVDSVKKIDDKIDIYMKIVLIELGLITAKWAIGMESKISCFKIVVSVVQLKGLKNLLYEVQGH